MKRILTTISLFLAVFALNAQKPSTTPEKAKHSNMRKPKMETLKKLNLDEGQKQKMKVLHEGFRAKMKELNGQENITVKEQRERKAAILKSHKEEMKQVLTPVQLKKMEEMKVEHKQKFERKRDELMLNLREKLNLSNDQFEAINKDREQYTTKIKALKDDKSMDKTAKRAQLKAIHEEMKASMEKQLTKEQIEQLKLMHKQKRHKNA